MKKLLKLLVVLVVVIIAAVLIAWWQIDRIVKAGVERGGTYALQVDTTVDTVSLSLLGGTLMMDGLQVANPEGYKTPYMIRSGRFDLAVDTGSVMGDTVQVNKFEIDGLDIYIEQKLGGSNVKAVMKNLERFEGSGGEPPEEGKAPEPAPGKGKNVQVDRIVIRNVVAHVQLLPVAGKASTVTVEVPEIVLEGVTSDNAAGVAVPELVARVVPAILMAVVKKGGDVLPGDFAKDLSGSIVQTADALGKGAETLLNRTSEGIGKGIRDLFTKPGDGSPSTEPAPDDNTQGQKKDALGEGLKNLFKKKDDAPPAE